MHNKLSLSYTVLRFNERFQQMLLKLDEVVRTENFVEYKHRSLFQVYLRIPTNLKTNDRCYCFFEPQTNLSKSIRDHEAVLKLQITLIKGRKVAGDSDFVVQPFQSHPWATLKLIIHHWAYDDILKYLNACQYWTNEVAALFKDQLSSQETWPLFQQEALPAISGMKPSNQPNE